MLSIQWTTEEPEPTTATVWAIPLPQDHDAEALGKHHGKAVQAALADSPFAGKPGETFTFTRERDGALERVTFFGLGKGLEDARSLRTFGHDVARHAQSVGAKRAVIDLSVLGVGAKWSDGIGDPVHAGELLAQGLQLGTYAYERFLSEDKRRPRTLREVVVRADDTGPAEGTARGQIVAEAIALARDLANGPGELVTPTHLAEQAQAIVARHRDKANASVEILDRDECQKRGMGCYLGVAKGSAQPPKFIHLTYKPKGSSKGKVALIGKGVTFDSGGYSLKPTEGMNDMKLDMSGSAVVIGAFEGLVRLGVPYEVHVIVAATENMIGGNAYRLGDVLTASNGKTVEINNTDAEGRLTLADALVYASALEPDYMLDFATLTGACMVALGPKIAGVMSPDDELAGRFMDAADSVGETMWRLPLPEDLKEQLKSNIADMKNTGERWGGALTAGLFLSEFTEGRRWVHVDIAGPSIVSKAYGVTTAGGSGFGVASILEFLR